MRNALWYLRPIPLGALSRRDGLLQTDSGRGSGRHLLNSATHKMLLRRVSEIGSLPAMPTILQSLGECLSANPSNANIDRIVELISNDKSLAGQCFRMANSAM